MNRHARLVPGLLLALFLWQNAVPGDRVCAAPTNETAEDEFEEFGEEFDIPDEPREWDPLRGYNRIMFTVNDKLYFWAFRPIARVYSKVFPQPLRLSVQRCAKNLGAPSRLVNNTLQGKFKGAGTELARFGVNTTVGILGLFDPADTIFHMKPSAEEDFGQTLGRYGVGEGFPLVLPLLGQSNLRDVVGLVPGYFLHPVSYIESTEWRIGLRCYEKENLVSLHLGEYESLKEDAMDPYILLRNAYRQSREAGIKE
ncbi:VacJ family lipoprotein [Verrucomicrobiota bacterium]